MAQPTPYVRGFSFTDYQAVNPVTPLPGDKVDIELNALQQTLGQICANLALIQRDDGQLANLSVGAEQLKTSISFGINSATTWGVGVAYAIRDGVWYQNKLYICLVGHTSTVFATDLAAGRWSLILDLNTYLVQAQDAAVNAIVAANEAEAYLADFQEQYLGSSSADPTEGLDGGSLHTGALYFSTATNRMRVYNGSAWADVQNAAVRTVYRYIATAAQTVFTGADANAAVLSYAANDFVTVYQQGLRLAATAYTPSGGTTVTLGSGATVSDVIQIEVLSPVAGLGTLGAQNSNNVAITGGLISGTTIRNWCIRIAFSGNVSALTDQLVFTAPSAVTFKNMRYMTKAGTCAVTLKKGASTITGASAVAVSSTPAAAALSTNGNFAQNDVCNITIGSVSSAQNLEIWIDAEFAT